jgi:hypothetical protein
MAAIEAIVFAGAAGFALIVVATVLVIIGVRQEERHKTLLYGPPTIVALLARCVLRAHITVQPDQQSEVGGPEEEPPWFERPVGPRAR